MLQNIGRGLLGRYVLNLLDIYYIDLLTEEWLQVTWL